MIKIVVLSTLIEYDPPHRLSYTSNEDNDPMIVSVDFTVVNGGTQIRLVQANIPDMQVGEGVKLNEIIREGWTAALGKLDIFLSGV